MKRRKIAVITGSRADYGHLYWIIKGIKEEPALKLQLFVTGMQLSPEFGLTVREIQKDGFPIAEKIEWDLSSDTEEAIATSMGMGMINFAKAYSRLKPDIVVVLGDRFELHAAVSAAVPFRIPVAHIHGGEATEGAFDEQLRHAITKMSHIHFTSNEEYSKRIIQMGENPKNVFCFGSPGIDNIIKLKLLDREGLSRELDIPKDKKIGVVTYHPVTLEHNSSKQQISELLAVLKKEEGIFWVFTLTNADTNGRIVNKMIGKFVKEHPERSRLYPSLGQRRYLSLLKNASLMVGNSSSGLIEAPSFQLPVVNIGDRQRGRIRALNVIDVKKCKREYISDAIVKTLSAEFRESLKGLKNPYGEGNSSEKIVNTLKAISINEDLIKKEFYEIKIMKDLASSESFKNFEVNMMERNNNKIRSP